METRHTRRRRAPSSGGRPSSYKGRNRGRNFSGGNRNKRRGGGSSGRGGYGRRSARVMPTFDPTKFINKNPVKAEVVEYVPEHLFSDFAIDRRLVNTLTKMGITKPSPIQDQVIPTILDGKDVVGLAETGTGKTAAFLVPLIELIRQGKQTQILILTPTRELALQIEKELRQITQNLNFYSTVCVGGTSIRPQIRNLNRRNHFIIGTPGRILDLINRRNIRTEKFSAVVLDEADRMLDMGFIHDMRKILENFPEDKQTLFFSATMDEKTKGLIHDFMKDPVVVSVKKKDVTDSIFQDVVPYNADKKFDVLLDLLKNEEFSRVIIFGAMKHSVEKLSQSLVKSGIKAESIHGNKNHNQRQRSLARFKSGNARILVATDVAARGIHVDNVSHVINYDLPSTFEDYVHRIGRTGRAEKKGIALTFVKK